MVCVVDSAESYQDWQRALEPYVLQASPITQVYQFKEKLGQGTFGYVYLAEPKAQVKDAQDLDAQKVKGIDKTLSLMDPHLCSP